MSKAKSGSKTGSKTGSTTSNKPDEKQPEEPPPPIGSTVLKEARASLNYDEGSTEILVQTKVSKGKKENKNVEKEKTPSKNIDAPTAEITPVAKPIDDEPADAKPAKPKPVEPEPANAASAEAEPDKSEPADAPLTKAAPADVPAGDGGLVKAERADSLTGDKKEIPQDKPFGPGTEAPPVEGDDDNELADEEEEEEEKEPEDPLPFCGEKCQDSPICKEWRKLAKPRFFVDRGYLSGSQMKAKKSKACCPCRSKGFYVECPNKKCHTTCPTRVDPDRKKILRPCCLCEGGAPPSEMPPAPDEPPPTQRVPAANLNPRLQIVIIRGSPQPLKKFKL